MRPAGFEARNAAFRAHRPHFQSISRRGSGQAVASKLVRQRFEPSAATVVLGRWNERSAAISSLSLGLRRHTGTPYTPLFSSRSVGCTSGFDATNRIVVERNEWSSSGNEPARTSVKNVWAAWLTVAWPSA